MHVFMDWKMSRSPQNRIEMHNCGGTRPMRESRRAPLVTAHGVPRSARTVAGPAARVCASGRQPQGVTFAPASAIPAGIPPRFGAAVEPPLSPQVGGFSGETERKLMPGSNWRSSRRPLRDGLPRHEPLLQEQAPVHVRCPPPAWVPLEARPAGLLRRAVRPSWRSAARSRQRCQRHDNRP